MILVLDSVVGRTIARMKRKPSTDIAEDELVSLESIYVIFMHFVFKSFLNNSWSSFSGVDDKGNDFKSNCLVWTGGSRPSVTCLLR